MGQVQTLELVGVLGIDKCSPCLIRSQVDWLVGGFSASTATWFLNICKASSLV